MSRKGHVTATDNADAAMVLDVLESAMNAGIDPGVRTVAGNTIARLLADKREEWIACALLRVERTFRVKRTAEVRGDIRPCKTREK